MITQAQIAATDFAASDALYAKAYASLRATVVYKALQAIPAHVLFREGWNGGFAYFRFENGVKIYHSTAA